MGMWDFLLGKDRIIGGFIDPKLVDADGRPKCGEPNQMTPNVPYTARVESIEVPHGGLKYPRGDEDD